MKNCSETNDIVCECIDGYFMQNDFGISEARNCKKHSKCEPGEGLAEKGTLYKDTICQPCQERVTFSDISSLDPCKPCSSCNTVIQNCTSTQDAVCDHTFTEGPGSTESPSTGIGVEKIVGIVGGVVGVVVAVLVVVVFIRCRRQNSKRDDSEQRNDIESHKTLLTITGEVAEKYKSHLPEHNGTLTIDAIKHPQQNGCSNGLVQQSENFDQKRCKETAIVNGKTVSGIEQIGNNELSIDASPVPPRCSKGTNQNTYGVPQTRRNSELGGDEVGATAPQNTQPENTCSAPCFDEMCQAESVQAAHGRMNGASEINNDIFRSQMEGLVWETVTSFLSVNMTMDDFKRFFRKLAARTSAPFYETVDTTIDDVQTEQRYSTETKYQLMKRWRETTPAATVEDILNILRECQFHQICEQLERKLLRL